MNAGRSDWRKMLVSWIFPQPEIARVDVYQPPRAPVGVHAFRRETENGVRKLFLRVDDGGAGVLIADASEALRLSPVGCFVVHGLLSGVAQHTIREKLPARIAGSIVEEAMLAIDELGRPNRRYPAMSLIDPLEGDGTHGIEPLQGDVEAIDDPAALRRAVDWLVRAGIPHVRFLLPERNPREVRQGAAALAGAAGLAQAIEYAEDRGLIAGVRLTAGEAVVSAALSRWIDLGLDYLVLPVGLTEAAHRRAFGDDDWRSLERAFRLTNEHEIAAVVEIGLTADAFDALEGTIDRFVCQGGNYVETYAIIGDQESGEKLRPAQLPQLATFVEDLGSRGTTPIAFLPPIHARGRSIEQILRGGPRTAGDLALRIDAAGSIFLPRGLCKPIGSVSDDWSALRVRPKVAAFRQIVAALELCEAAPLASGHLSPVDSSRNSPAHPLTRPQAWAEEC
jgi:hypothetical protein